MIKKKKKVKNSQQPPQQLTLKKLVITDFSGINYFKQKHGGGKKEALTSAELVEKFRQDFKKLDVNFRLKILFHYIKMKTQGGIYKKEGNATIGKYFGVGKDLINGYIGKLKETKHIEELTEIDIQKLKNEHTYYKLLKEDFVNE